MKKVLSIDGGGIRGIIPAMILSHVEDRTGKPVSELFDWISGTSTGGILALGLAKPDNHERPQYSADDMMKLYEKEAGRIFSRSAWHRVYSFDGTAEEKYPSKDIEEVLDEYFGEARLQDALTNVLITSYEIEQRLPFFFNSKDAKEDKSYDFFMKHVARATSAAPTYFEPCKVETDGPVDYYALVDGGVYANNPALCAYAEVVSLDKGEDILMVSLGTGELTRSLPYDEVKGWGLIHWAQPILNVVFDGVSDTVDYQMKQLLPLAEGKKRYYRFQKRLEEGSDDLDDVSPANMRALKLLANNIIHEQNDTLNDLCEQLKG